MIGLQYALYSFVDHRYWRLRNELRQGSHETLNKDDLAIVHPLGRCASGGDVGTKDRIPAVLTELAEVIVGVVFADHALVIGIDRANVFDTAMRSALGHLWGWLSLMNAKWGI